MIQPTGLYLRLSSGWQVKAVSANIGDFLPLTADQALGQPIGELLGDDAIHDMRNRMALLRSEESVEHLLHVALIKDSKPFDLSIFRDGDGFGIDAEPCDGHAFGDATGIVEGMLGRVVAAGEAGSIANEAARQVRALTGFDRVLIYGDGALLGQSARSGGSMADASAGQCPGHDLAVADRTADPVEILTADGSPAHRSTLRIPTPDEAAILAANEARAALIVPMIRDGQPWGQVACYHSTARHIGVERRGVVRLFARIIALRIEIADLRRG